MTSVDSEFDRFQHPLLPTIWDDQRNWFWKDDKGDKRFDHGDGYDRYKRNDDRKDGKNDRAPSPAPEPSTILSFGAALIIGAGVLLLRRIPGVRK